VRMGAAFLRRRSGPRAFPVGGAPGRPRRAFHVARERDGLEEIQRTRFHSGCGALDRRPFGDGRLRASGHAADGNLSLGRWAWREGREVGDERDPGRTGWPGAGRLRERLRENLLVIRRQECMGPEEDARGGAVAAGAAWLTHGLSSMRRPLETPG